MFKKVFISVVIVLIAVAVLGGVKALQIGAMIEAGKNATMPPQTVTSATVLRAEWPVTLSAIGSISAVQGSTISSELPGTVTKIAFESGARVDAGALLVQLDISTELAQMQAADAATELARLELDRARSLRRSGTNSAADLDMAEATYKEARATIATLEATIAKKTIRAPFAGRVGIREIDPGQYVGPGTPIVSLQSIDPVYVDFSLPQRAIERARVGLTTRVVIDGFPGRVFDGTVTAIDADLDRRTRSITLQARLRNERGELRPGMFARVELLLPGEREVLTIPATAVLSAPYGDSVFLIEPRKGENGDADSLALRQAFVRIGEARGDLVAVESGLEADATVVSSGVFKLRNGVSVVVDNTLAPDVQLAPTPAEG